MARDPESLKIVPWAQTGDRVNPEAASSPAIDRSVGWPSDFSSSESPRRQVFNQILRELTGIAHELNTRGVLEYSNQINYVANAYVQQGGELYRAISANGPGSTVETPGASGGTRWELVTGRIVQAGKISAPTIDHFATSLQMFWELSLIHI